MKTLYGLALLAVALYAVVVPAHATSTSANVGFGNLFFNDNIVRTVVPPSALPNEGLDNFYKVTNSPFGSSQLGITAVAPGSPNYHGGHWAVSHVTWVSGTPVLLKSEAEVLAAKAAGSVTVTRVAMEDFLCPVQP